MWNELVDSVREYLKERVTSPLLSSFTFAWVVWNYRFITVLFSDQPYQIKFSFIDNELFKDGLTLALHGVIGPVGSAALFIWLYPVLAKIVYRYWRKQQKQMREIRQKIENEQIITLEESRRLFERIYRLEKKYNEDISSRDQDVAKLKELLSAYEGGTNTESINALQLNKMGDDNSTLNVTKNRIISSLADFERNELEISDTELISILAEKWNVDKVETKLAMEQLIGANVITKSYSRERAIYLIELTQKGREQGLLLRDQGDQKNKS